MGVTKMAKAGAFTFTKAELKRIKNSEAKITDAQRREISKALVKANSAANTPKKRTA